MLKLYIDEFTTHYHQLHQHPELSFLETETSEYVTKVLNNYGLEVVQLSNNAVLGLLKGAEHGKTIGVRAELDALPLQEATGVPFASVNSGVMHACGHDLHMAIALGAAKLLSDETDALHGNVLFVFQHAEEKIPGGAQDVIGSEFFQKHKPDIMLALHSFPDLKAGEFGAKAGAYMASGDEIDLLINGPGGHAALPHQTVDTVLVASQIVVALQQVTSRFIPSQIPAILTFGNIAANSVMNIIPKQVKIEGTFRIVDEEWRGRSLNFIEQVASHTAQAAGATCQVVIRNGYPAITNDKLYTQIVSNTLIDTFGEAAFKNIPLRMTTDDFGYYAQTIPSVYFRLGVADASGVCAGLHTSEFLPHISALEYGIIAWFHVIKKMLNQ